MVFVGRTKELEILEGIRNRNGVKTCMIYGKRRHGKSELIKHFCENHRSLKFEFTLGSLESQLEYMTDVISVARDKQIDTYRTVYSCLRDIVQFCRESETIVVFDEFQYLANDDDAVSSEIQRFVDTLLDGTETMVIICGSHSSMMLELTCNPVRPLYGRFMDRILLGPLSIEECMQLHPRMNDLDNLRLYLTIGGVAGFHTSSDEDTYEKFVWDLFMRDHAPLRDDVQLLIGLGLSQYPGFTKIVSAVATGAVSNKTIAEKAGLEQKTCNVLLKKLVDMDVLSTHHPMYGAPKRPVYFISENAVAFYYEVYEANRARIDPSRFEMTMDNLRQKISTFLGIRFEMLCRAYVRKNYYCLEVGRWWGASGERDEKGRPIVVDIDVTARVVENGSTFDVFGECKLRNRLFGFHELNELVSRAELTGANVNARYMLFSTSGFNEDLLDYADQNQDLVLVDLDAILGRRATKPL